MRSTDHSSRCARTRVDRRCLDIEVVRFGPQLTVDKQIAPQTLDVIVPSMILQPLVENSIKHGLARKVGGGHITIRASVLRRPRDHPRYDDGLA
jgi:two-component system LytT family sensor kinase